MATAPFSPFRPLSADQLRSSVRGRARSHTDSSTADHLVDLVEALDTVYDQSDLGLVVRVMGLRDPDGELDIVSAWSDSIYDQLLGVEFPPNCDAVALMVHGRARSTGDDDHEPGHVLGRARVVFAVARDGTSASLLRIGDEDGRVVVGGGEECVGRLSDVVRRGFGLDTSPPDDDVSTLTWLVWLDRIHERVLSAEPVDIGLVDSLRPNLPDTWKQLLDESCQGRWPELRIHPELASWMDEGLFARSCREGFIEPIEIMIELGELLDRPVWLHLVRCLTGDGGLTSN